MELRGAVAVVTGASSGFGELTSRLLAKEGSVRRAGGASRGAAGGPGRRDRGAGRPGPRREVRRDRGRRPSGTSRPGRGGLRPMRRPDQQRRHPRWGTVRGPLARADRASHPGEPAGRDGLHEGVPPDDARAGGRPHRERGVAGRTVCGSGRLRVLGVEARRGGVLRGAVLRARASGHPGDEREPGVRRDRGLPARAVAVGSRHAGGEGGPGHRASREGGEGPGGRRCRGA